MDINQMKEMFFNLLDIERDGRICETDMFYAFKSVDTIASQQLLQADLQILMKYMNKQRAKMGADDPERMAISQVDQQVLLAQETGKLQN